MSEGAPPPDPLLSIVVTVVDGLPALGDFLAALRDQDDPPPLEVLVPYDDSVAEVAQLAPSFPAVTFLAIGPIPTTRPLASAAGQHELYDRRRAAGLARARGSLVAILEDRGVPRADWARTAVRLHAIPAMVIGGAIEPSAGRLLEWALHVCDFSRYSLPFPQREAEWVSDVNVVYKRIALESTRELWRERFAEARVHWELARRGETLLLSPELVVDHRRVPRRLGTLLRERRDWGRLFGATRAAEVPTGRRLLLCLAAPLVPPLLLWRHAKVWRRRGEGARFLRALPVLVMLLTAWTVGETIGQLTGRP